MMLLHSDDNQVRANSSSDGTSPLEELNQLISQIVNMDDSDDESIDDPLQTSNLLDNDTISDSLTISGCKRITTTKRDDDSESKKDENPPSTKDTEKSRLSRPSRPSISRRRSGVRRGYAGESSYSMSVPLTFKDDDLKSLSGSFTTSLNLSNTSPKQSYPRAA